MPLQSLLADLPKRFEPIKVLMHLQAGVRSSIVFFLISAACSFLILGSSLGQPGCCREKCSGPVCADEIWEVTLTCTYIQTLKPSIEETAQREPHLQHHHHMPCVVMVVAFHSSHSINTYWPLCAGKRPLPREVAADNHRDHVTFEGQSATFAGIDS